MPSVLFVCKANRIRSPIAAGLFQSLIQKEGLAADWRVESVGTWAVEGLPIHRNAATVLFDEYGLDLRGHSSRSVSVDILSRFALTLTMEQDQKEALIIEYPTMAKRIFQLSEMVGGNWDIADPEQHSVENIRVTAKLIATVLQEGLDRIVELASADLAVDAKQ